MRRESAMGKIKYAKHSAEFRTEALRVVRESRVPLARIARELAVNENTLRLWVKEARADEDPPLNEDERAELQRLRQQVRTLRMEREILKKAAAFFAKHGG
jgi:transposase